MHGIWNDPQVQRHLGPPTEISSEVTRRAMTRLAAHWRRHGFGQWAVDWRDGGTLIGYCGFKLWEGEGPEIELVYGLAPAYWHQGIGTEAVRAAMAAAFAQLGLRRVLAGVVADNAASIRVLEKTGFHLERYANAAEGRIGIYAIQGPSVG